MAFGKVLREPRTEQNCTSPHGNDIIVLKPLPFWSLSAFFCFLKQELPWAYHPTEWLAQEVPFLSQTDSIVK